MPSLANHHSSSFTKLMYIGDSSTGKTGSLTSLLVDGYSLRFLDYDNGLDPLVAFAEKAGVDLNLVSYVTLRDEYKAGPSGPMIKGMPTAFMQGMKLMDKWEDGSSPSEWGDKTILVVDSMTNMGKAAFEWAKAMNPGAKDPRQWYGAAQMALESFISLVTGEAFRANVIIISHINYIELQNGMTKGFPSAIGSAFSTKVARYFNTLIMAETSGSGKNVRRTIRTVPSGVVDLKTAKPFSLEAELPLETGMSKIFKLLKSKGE